MIIRKAGGREPEGMEKSVGGGVGRRKGRKGHLGEEEEEDTEVNDRGAIGLKREAIRQWEGQEEGRANLGREKEGAWRQLGRG